MALLLYPELARDAWLDAWRELAPGTALRHVEAEAVEIELSLLEGRGGIIASSIQGGKSRAHTR